MNDRTEQSGQRSRKDLACTAEATAYQRGEEVIEVKRDCTSGRFTATAFDGSSAAKRELPSRTSDVVSAKLTTCSLPATVAPVRTVPSGCTTR